MPQEHETALTVDLQCPTRDDGIDRTHPCLWAIKIPIKIAIGKADPEDPKILPLILKSGLTRYHASRVRAHLRISHPELGRPGLLLAGETL